MGRILTTLALAIVVCSSLTSCSGTPDQLTGLGREPAGASPRGPSGEGEQEPSPEESPELTTDDVAEYEALAAELRGEIQDYLALYAEFQELTPSSWAEYRAAVREGAPRIENQLRQMIHLHKQLLKSAKAGIEYITEVQSGEVAAETIREYLRVVGAWMKNQLQQNRSSLACVRLPRSEGLDCILRGTETEGREGARLAMRLQELQQELFG